MQGCDTIRKMSWGSEIAGLKRADVCLWTCDGDKRALRERMLCFWVCDGKEQRPKGRGGEGGLSVFLEEISKLMDGRKKVSRRMGVFGQWLGQTEKAAGTSGMGFSFPVSGQQQGGRRQRSGSGGGQAAHGISSRHVIFLLFCSYALISSLLEKTLDIDLWTCAILLMRLVVFPGACWNIHCGSEPCLGVVV